MHEEIGGFQPSDVEFVAAFDIDRRKVGRPLEEAVFAAPNCTRRFQPEHPANGMAMAVRIGPVLDGVASGAGAGGPGKARSEAAERPGEGS